MAASATVSDVTTFTGNFELPAISVSEITVNTWAWWWDTINLKLFIVRNRAGILYAVEATPL